MESKLTQDTDAYIQQLTPKERKAYEIAKSHLKTSFDLEKSIGFKEFMKKMTKKDEV